MNDGLNTNINPYLTFPGNCEQAMTFYKDVFDGDLETMPYEESPVDVPDDYKNKLMHATLRFGKAVLMAADAQPGQEINFGDGIHISVNVPTVDLAEQYFNQLAASGTIITPFELTFWGAKFGMLTDRFGVNWMVHAEVSQ